jgi:hypothetical protein
LEYQEETGLRRRDVIGGSLAAALTAALKVQAASVLPGFFPGAGKSRLRRVRVGNPVPLGDNQGDTWVAAWADDDTLYSPSDDTSGFHKAANANVAFNRISGGDPMHLSGVTVNPLQDYGKEGQKGPDHCTWKSSGCTFIDGVLYLVVARHMYGEDSDDPNRRQTAQNASIIKSTDLGQTWTRTAHENYEAPMFPGRRFATPYFIEFGHEGSSQANVGDYIYALSNNGFWDCGDDMVLGRVARSRIGFLNGFDWEFYNGGNGHHARAWTKNMENAKPVLIKAGRLGMTGAVYLHARQRYLMIGWYYPAGGGKIKGAATHTKWDFYEAPRPWGPWTRIGSYDSQPSGYYSPEICPKFQTADKVFAFAAGNWNSSPDYRLTVFPLEIVV